ncbi:MAG TPA: hypothetical protein VFN23_00780 [Ktedonobacteraceae bacterium]|nr:hypothetical protein [Ktedonobacteraceae bacterium]
MKRSFLDRLKTNGLLAIAGAIVLLLGIPLYQLLLLAPQGYSEAFNATGTNISNSFLLWISGHTGLFIGYRLLLALAFALLLTFPFTLFRIIVAQEILEGSQLDDTEEEDDEDEDDEDEDEDEELTIKDNPATPLASTEKKASEEANGMPDFAWRGKGFAIIAAWSGLIGLGCIVVGTLFSMIYIAGSAAGFTAQTAVPANFIWLVSLLTILTNTVGGGLMALSTLFFGAMIARRGLRLWPRNWLFFGYAALAVAALYSGSAVAVASAPGQGQAALTTPAILLFALWILWFGLMLVRLKPE